MERCAFMATSFELSLAIVCWQSRCIGIARLRHAVLRDIEELRRRRSRRGNALFAGGPSIQDCRRRHRSDSTRNGGGAIATWRIARETQAMRSEEHTSELQSLMRISYAVFCLKNKTTSQYNTSPIIHNNHSY